MDSEPEGSKLLPRRVYFTVLGVLFLFWATMIVCVAVVVSMAAWDSRSDDEVSAEVPSATASAAPPTATPMPAQRPAEVPLTATPIDRTFDSGEVELHLFFHIGCVEGVIAVVTTDEIVYAESFCSSIPQDEVEPFLGRPVRITIDEGRLDVVSIDGARLQFGVQRAWVEDR